LKKIYVPSRLTLTHLYTLNMSFHVRDTVEKAE